MPMNVLMPSLFAGMEEATLSRWIKKPGDEVAKGEALAEIESDKASFELEAPEDGILRELVVADETHRVPVGALLAVLLTKSDIAGQGTASSARELVRD